VYSIADESDTHMPETSSRAGVHRSMFSGTRSKVKYIYNYTEHRLSMT